MNTISKMKQNMVFQKDGPFAYVNLVIISNRLCLIGVPDFISGFGEADLAEKMIFFLSG